MKRNFQAVIFAVICGASFGVAAEKSSPAAKPIAKPAATVTLPAGVTEEMLAPPPVPRFMTEKQDKPLSMDEMTRQAREAEQKAGARPAQKAAKPREVAPADKKSANDTPSPAK